MRSLFGVPLDDMARVGAATRAGADALLLDLQAMVAPEAKEKARANIAAALSAAAPAAAWVRVATCEQEEALDSDLEAAVRPRVRGVVLPEAESSEQVRELDARLGALERGRGLPQGGLAIMPFPETALAIHDLYEILSASDRCQAVLFPSARGGDLNRDVGFSWSAEGTEMIYMRQKVVVDARAAGVVDVIDGGWVDLDDDAGFDRDCARSRGFGYTGRFAFSPAQAEIANLAYAFSERQLEGAREEIAAWETERPPGAGLIEHGGRIIDATTVAHARRILALHQSKGAK